VQGVYQKRKQAEIHSQVTEFYSLNWRNPVSGPVVAAAFSAPGLGNGRYPAPLYITVGPGRPPAGECTRSAPEWRSAGRSAPVRCAHVKVVQGAHQTSAALPLAHRIHTCAVWDPPVSMSVSLPGLGSGCPRRVVLSSEYIKDWQADMPFVAGLPLLSAGAWHAPCYNKSVSTAESNTGFIVTEEHPCPIPSSICFPSREKTASCI